MCVLDLSVCMYAFIMYVCMFACIYGMFWICINFWIVCFIGTYLYVCMYVSFVCLNVCMDIYVYALEECGVGEDSI